MNAQSGADVSAEPVKRSLTGKGPARRRLELSARADRDRQAQCHHGAKRAQHRLRRYLGLALIALSLLAVPPAYADGDPASDILLTESVYFGYGIDLQSKEAAQLVALLDEARKRGYPLKVALISDVVDLGVTTQNWENPREYVRYLAGQLSEVYTDRLLVLMPNGYGVFHDDAVPGRERRVVAKLKRPGQWDTMLDRAIDAVLAISAANGVS